MIFYFSGTGNSLWVARTLSDAFHEPLVSIAKTLRKASEGDISFTIGEGERVFFVFPVHSWGPAVLALRFIQRLTLLGYKRQSVYFVCTCGDDCGRTDRIVRQALAQRGIRLTNGFSVQMPNNYILLPGFDVDTEEVAQRKLQDAPARLAEITDHILRADPSPLYVSGSLPALKTCVYPLFTHIAIHWKKFYATEACVSCGLCVKVCPTGTISLSEAGKPVWSDGCVNCVACIHRCPVRAIEYGKISLHKGRYHHPDLAISHKGKEKG